MAEIDGNDPERAFCEGNCGNLAEGSWLKLGRRPIEFRAECLKRVANNKQWEKLPWNETIQAEIRALQMEITRMQEHSKTQQKPTESLT